MRKMICDKCGKEITYGSDYVKIDITRENQRKPRNSHNSDTVQYAISTADSIRKKEEYDEYSRIRKKEFCTDCAAEIIKYIDAPCK